MPYEALRPTFALTEERIDQLRQLVPEAFADGKIDWTALRETLGDWLEDEGEAVEHFGLNWPGKREARRTASIPSKGSIVPVPGEGVSEDTTRNFFVEGDNLEVLKLLQKSYSARVQMIYVDPPYNTGNDFVYEDDFNEPVETYLRRTGQLSEGGTALSTNTRSDGRFHSKWLSMMYPRLRIMRGLLAPDGLIVVSIDDGEVHHLRCALNEIFGEECFVAQIVWKSRKFPDARAVTGVSTDHEYLLIYARTSDGALRGIDRDETKFSNPDNDPRGPWMSRSILGLATAAQRPNLHYPIFDPSNGRRFDPPSNTGWRYAKDRMTRLINEGSILFPPKKDGRPREKKFRKDMQSEFISFPSILDGIHTADGTAEIRELFGYDAFDFPKPSELIRRLVEQATDKDGLVFDPFAGSCTIGHAVALQNRLDGGQRTYLACQLPEPVPQGSRNAEAGLATIADVGKRRLRLTIKSLKAKAKPTPNEDLGFRVFKLERSSFLAWHNYEGDNINKLADLFSQTEKPLADGWTRDGLLVEVMLMEGFPLDSAVSKLESNRNDVRRITSDASGHALVTCFDERLYAETLRVVDLSDTDVFICLDSALTDEMKLRLADRCVLKTI